jgi:hypothetical protein
MKPLLFVLLLITLVMGAGAYLQFNPVILIFAILGIGIYWLCRSAPALPPMNLHPWGSSGHGIYFDRDDQLVEGREPETTYNVNDGAPRDAGGDQAKR